MGKFNKFRREIQKGKSRFDFEVEFPNVVGYVEVKSVSMVESGVGKFPDAPTEWGRKHLQELIGLRHHGFRSAVIFVSQRSDARSITSNDSIDAEFGSKLRDAYVAGVEIYGYNCRVTASTVSLNRQLEIVL